MLEMKELCVVLFAGAMLVPGAMMAASAREGNGPLLLLDDAECWKRMPPVESGGTQPLPTWAKAVAVRLPRTAASMLELDLAQRTKGPLDPVLRAKMRWVIARANKCAYSEAYALADLARASGDAAAAKILTGDPAQWSEADREPLFWWLCRGLYMTRISDGFQLPLERDNVFTDFYGKGTARPEAATTPSK